MNMTVRITHTLQRTIDLDVEEQDEEAAIQAALLIASNIQPADWDYTWEPTHTEGCVLKE